MLGEQYLESLNCFQLLNEILQSHVMFDDIQIDEYQRNGEKLFFSLFQSSIQLPMNFLEDRSGGVNGSIPMEIPFRKRGRPDRCRGETSL